MHTDTLYRFRPEIPFHHIQQNGHYILIHKQKPLWVVVNETGFRIARLCDGRRTIPEVANSLAAIYGIDQRQAFEDTEAFLGALAAGGWFGQEDELPRPASLKSLFIQLTERCNLRCKHCYTGSRPGRSTKLPTGKILGLIDEFSRLKGVEITLSGGEPLTHPDILNIIKYAAAKSRVQLLTNGTLIDKETARLLSDLGVRVQISLDGSSISVHDRIRGDGNYAKARRGIKLLTEAGARVNLNLCTVIMRDNLEDLLNIIDLAQELKIPLLRFIPLRCSGRAQNNWVKNQPSVAEHTALFRHILAKPHSSLQVNSGLTGLVFSSPRQKVQKKWCPLGQKLDVLPGGDVYPCVFMAEKRFYLGNVYRQSLTDILYSPKLKRIAQMCASRREKIDKCRECLWVNFCQTGCPGLAYAQTENLQDTDQYCQLRKELYPKIIFNTAQNKMEAVSTCC
jgi:radical SAM protein with 4Fe4S-binding SPASM domain